MELPVAFIEQLQSIIPAQWQALCDAITTTQPAVSVRVNSGRGASRPASAVPVPWCPTGFYLAERQQFTFDPLFHSGLYYVQDASSMFLHHVIKFLIDTPVRYLDLCAAPGGKTTTALDALPQGSLVVANEIIPARARVLRDNVLKWGNPYAVVTSDSPSKFGQLTAMFDVIAADVPCSGEGMMRKDDEAVAQWTPALVDECAARQRSIISDVWPALRPGGLLIYSTCTYNRAENEEMIEHIISTYGAQPVTVPTLPEWNISPAIGNSMPAYRFMPHLTRGEGLFMAVLRKPDDEKAHTTLRTDKTNSKLRDKTQALPQGISNWVDRSDDFRISPSNDEVVASPAQWATEIASIQKRLNVLTSGITLATVKGKNCVPAHALALNSRLNSNAFAHCEVDYSTAIAYLRGEAVSIDAPRGYVLITHRNAPLGWVNNLGNRANNLYPKSLRILSTHIPDAPPSIICC